MYKSLSKKKTNKLFNELYKDYILISNTQGLINSADELLKFMKEQEINQLKK